MSDREDYERAVNPQFHVTQKIRIDQDETPTHVKVLYVVMALSLIGFAVATYYIQRGGF